MNKKREKELEASLRSKDQEISKLERRRSELLKNMDDMDSEDDATLISMMNKELEDIDIKYNDLLKETNNISTDLSNIGQQTAIRDYWDESYEINYDY